MSDPTLEDLLSELITSRAADLRVCLPGIIESYDPAKQIVDVQPALQRPGQAQDGTSTSRRLPVIHSVPVVFPRTAAGFFVSLPIKKGDSVLLIFSDFSLDRWKSTGREVDPESTGSHEIADAFAIVGGYAPSSPLANVNADDLIVGKDGGTTLRIKGSTGEIHLGQDAPADFVALASKVEAGLNAIKTIVNAHVHSGVTTGPGSSGPLVTPLSAVFDTAASKVKAL